MRTMEGGCHCGRVRFRVTAELDGVTICNCSICTKKGIWHLIVPPERFELLSRPGRAHDLHVQHRRRQASLLQDCGIHPFYVPRSDPDKIDVNARCLDDFDSLQIAPQAFRRPPLGRGDAAARAVALKDLAMNPLDGEIRDGRHFQPVRVYYEDTDFSGVVYHASYLRFMERGRTNYLRLLGADQRALFEAVERRRRALPSWCAR